MKYLLIAVLLAGCSTTVEERDAYRETGVILALTAIDIIKDIGLGPEEIDPQILKIASGACRLLQAGGPLIALAINTRVAEHNADVEIGDETSLVTVEEVQDLLNSVCDVIAAILTPPEKPEPADV